MKWTAVCQPVFLALVLAWSGAVKFAGRDMRARVAGTALHRLLDGRYAVRAYATVGVIEIALAVTLATIPGPLPAVGAAALSTMFAGYLTYAVLAAPQSSCGCMGAAHAQVSWRSFTRVGLLLLSALAAATTDSPWWTASALRSSVLLVGEAIVFVALSAELDRYWLMPLRRLKARLTHPLAGAPQLVPLQASVSQLLRSDAYRQVAAILTSDVREHWDADEQWRILCYGARHEERTATAVFAVPLLQENPDTIRVSIVYDEEIIGVGGSA